MKSLVVQAAELLAHCGPAEVVELTCRLSDSQKQPLAIQRLLLAAGAGESGLYIAEYPSYELRGAINGVPRRGYLRAAVDALSRSRTAVALPDLVRQCTERWPTAAKSPECWMYLKLIEATYIRRNGALVIAVKNPTVLSRTEVTPPRCDSIGRKMHERNLEDVLVANLEAIEHGLTLVERQCRTEVGVIDLLCRSANGDLVIVELKQAEASTDLVVAQLARYIGWAKEHLSIRPQRVRGIIVVGSMDTKLEYAIRAMDNVQVRCFRITLADPLAR